MILIMCKWVYTSCQSLNRPYFRGKQDQILLGLTLQKHPHAKVRHSETTLYTLYTVTLLSSTADCGTHPVATSHILIVLSRDDDTMKSPLGINDTLDTLWS